MRKFLFLFLLLVLLIPNQTKAGLTSDTFKVIGEVTTPLNASDEIAITNEVATWKANGYDVVIFAWYGDDINDAKNILEKLTNEVDVILAFGQVDNYHFNLCDYDPKYFDPYRFDLLTQSQIDDAVSNLVPLVDWVLPMWRRSLPSGWQDGDDSISNNVDYIVSSVSSNHPSKKILGVYDYQWGGRSYIPATSDTVLAVGFLNDGFKSRIMPRKIKQHILLKTGRDLDVVAGPVFYPKARWNTLGSKGIPGANKDAVVITKDKSKKLTTDVLNQISKYTGLYNGAISSSITVSNGWMVYVNNSNNYMNIIISNDLIIATSTNPAAIHIARLITNRNWIAINNNEPLAEAGYAALTNLQQVASDNLILMTDYNDYFDRFKTGLSSLGYSNDTINSMLDYQFVCNLENETATTNNTHRDQCITFCKDVMMSSNCIMSQKSMNGVFTHIGHIELTIANTVGSNEVWAIGCYTPYSNRVYSIPYMPTNEVAAGTIKFIDWIDGSTGIKGVVRLVGDGSGDRLGNCDRIGLHKYPWP